jgi:hypothetical protein
LDVLANVIDADLALTLGNLNCKVSAISQKLGIPNLEHIELEIPQLLAFSLVKHGTPLGVFLPFQRSAQFPLGRLVQQAESSHVHAKSVARLWQHLTYTDNLLQEILWGR